MRTIDKKASKTEVRRAAAEVRALLRDVEAALKADDLFAATIAARQVAASAIDVDEAASRLWSES